QLTSGHAESVETLVADVLTTTQYDWRRPISNRDRLRFRIDEEYDRRAASQVHSDSLFNIHLTIAGGENFYDRVGRDTRNIGVIRPIERHSLVGQVRDVGHKRAAEFPGRLDAKLPFGSRDAAAPRYRPSV